MTARRYENAFKGHAARYHRPNGRDGRLMVHGTAFLATIKALPAVGRIHNCKVRIQAVVKCHIGLTDSRIINAHEALYRVLFQKSTEDCTTARLTGLKYLVEDIWYMQNGIEKENGVIYGALATGFGAFAAGNE